MATGDIESLKSDQAGLRVGVSNAIDYYQTAQANYADAARTDRKSVV